MSDPYAGLASPVGTAPPDPYAGVAAPVASAAPVVMHSFTTKGKGGKPVTFQAPADATDDEIHQAAAKATGDKDYLKSSIIHRGETPPDTRPTSFLQGVGEGMDNVVNHGAVALQKGVNVLGGLFGAPQLGDKMEQFGGDHFGMAPNEEAGMKLQAADSAASPTQGSGFGRFSGTVLATIPLSRLPGGVVTQGAATGALLSDAPDAKGVAVDAGLGAVGGYIGGKIIAPVLGKAAGAAAPYVKKGLQTVGGFAKSGLQAVGDNVPFAKGVTQTLSDFLGTTPEQAAQIATTAKTNPKVGSIILGKLAAQGQTPEQAAQLIDQARGRGVPLALMDTGDETRGLASALSRKPGPSRTLLRDVVIPRQEEQLDRVQGAIRRDLGATANVRQQSEALAQQAKTDADPLYAKFRAEPARTSPELESLIGTPAGQKALVRAQNIAANDRVDPTKLGFTVDAEGNVALTKNPSPQTLDYIKQGLDDVVEDNRDKVTGRLVLNTAQRAENNVRGQFVAEMDRLYPGTYKAARQAYSGPASMASALAKGAKIGTRDSEQILAETQNLSAPELEQYKLGVRSALSKALEGKTDGADKVKALVGTPAKRKALAQLFGGDANFDNFMNTLADEGRAAATHTRVNTGSVSAANLADDADANGLTGVALNAGGRLLQGHGTVSNLFHTVKDLADYGAGKSGKEVRAQLAAGLSETDPIMLKDFLAAARAASAKRAANRTLGRIVGTGGAVTAAQVRN